MASEKGVLATNEALVVRAKTIIEAMGARDWRTGSAWQASSGQTPTAERIAEFMRRQACIIGGGIIGGGWAARFLLNG